VHAGEFTPRIDKTLTRIWNGSARYTAACAACGPAPAAGMPVSDLLRFVTYADGYGQFSLGRERFQELPDDVTPCVAAIAPAATVACPHGVKVAERIFPRPGAVRLMSAIACFVGGRDGGSGQAPDCGLLAGWVQQGPATNLRADNLFEYMDGNAEGYLLYHFVQMHGVNCQSVKILDRRCFQMENAEWAYGMFRLQSRPARAARRSARRRRSSAPRDPGQDNTSSRFASSKEQPICGVVVARGITSSSELPEALAWFPAG